LAKGVRFGRKPKLTPHQRQEDGMSACPHVSKRSQVGFCPWSNHPSDCRQQTCLYIRRNISYRRPIRLDCVLPFCPKPTLAIGRRSLSAGPIVDAYFGCRRCGSLAPLGGETCRRPSGMGLQDRT